MRPASHHDTHVDARGRRGPPPPMPGESHAERAHLRRLRRDISEATAHDRFILHYQPRIALRCGAIVGAEALIRWPHRKRGLMAPGSFIPVAEQSGQITDIGAWVLRAACVAATAWAPGIRVSVNVSARQDRKSTRLNSSHG